MEKMDYQKLLQLAVKISCKKMQAMVESNKSNGVIPRTLTGERNTHYLVLLSTSKEAVHFLAICFSRKFSRA